MKKGLIFTIALLLIATLWSCRKQVNCPPFIEADLQYVPYSPGDTIRFVSGQEIFELIIDELELSDDYDISCRARSNICPCYSYAEVRAHNTKYPETASFMLLEREDISNSRLFFYNFLRMRFEFDFVRDILFIHQRQEITLFEEIQINGKLYQNVIRYETYMLPDSDLSKIYFNEQYGILRFQERVNSKIWSRIPD